MVPRYLANFDLCQIPQLKTSIIIVGAGLAGMYTAIKASEQHHVLLVTKGSLQCSNTQHAQGGIAAVMSQHDSPQMHYEDTVIAGAGLCNPEAVGVLTQESAAGIDKLIQLGVNFDRIQGELALTREGAHQERRILHANGDATGAELIRALSEQVKRSERIEVLEHYMAVDIVTDANGACCGVLALTPNQELIFLRSHATVLCTGGAGRLYRYTTNPEIATGDGLAMAYRAGAVLRDLEFIQFHPTALAIDGGPGFLISEAVRGEGALLRNSSGERFMSKYDERMELAPRDIVARAILSEMEQADAHCVYLDMTHQSEAWLKQRFPTIFQECLKYGLNMAIDFIPVAPAAHYMMGGIKTNLYGETSVKQLFACGEVSSTGVHGANRLASNSLSEAIVFGERIAQRLKTLPALVEAVVSNAESKYAEVEDFDVEHAKIALQELMQQALGLRRSKYMMMAAKENVKKHLQGLSAKKLNNSAHVEYVNMLTCAWLIAQAALWREESRGAHYREDFPGKDDVLWKKHLVQHRTEGILEEREHAEL